MVYARVHAKGAGGKSVADDFTPEQMREEGVETTKNWFYKVASIRELVPRFYVELAIIRCYRMLMPASELPTVLRRMVQMVRGFGDPLAATYARSYLVHKAPRRHFTNSRHRREYTKYQRIATILCGPVPNRRR